jgi:hypothetical protein
MTPIDEIYPTMGLIPIPTKETEYYKFYRQQFTFVKGITWRDVDEQVEFEKQTGTYREISEQTGLVVNCAQNPGILQNITQQFWNRYELDTMHIFFSRAKEYAQTLGRHNDDQNVLITPSMGRIKYGFDNGDEVLLNPGDGLYIPKYVYHNPIHIEPRITVSMSGPSHISL